MIRWGTATNQNEITNLGVTRYTQAVYAYYTYWRDYFNAYPALWAQAKGSGFDPGWISKGYVPQIWDGKAKTSTFFGTYPTGVSVITSLPATSASFYQAIDKPWITSYTAAYEAYLKKWNMDPQNPQGHSAADPNQPWYSQLAYYGEMACWYAMADPSGALSKFFPLDPRTALTPDPTYQTLPINVYTEKGKDAAQVYHFVRFLQDYGVPEPLAAYATNTPYSMVFVKNGVKTYVGFNPGASMMDIRFNDGTVIANVSPRQFGFWPVGVPEPVQASFRVSPDSGSSPLVVTFTDTSKGSLTGWAWTFGDGGSSSEQNPVHTFTSQGAFQVNLTVTDVNSKTSTSSHIISVTKTGTLPGNFSISTFHTGSGTTGLYPSLIIDGQNNTSLFSFFSSDSAMPWNTGASGTIGIGKIVFENEQIKTSKDMNAVNLVYTSYPPEVAQPEWGRSSIALDKTGTPLISYLDLSPNYPQKLYLSWQNPDTSWGNVKITDGFPWSPSLAVIKGGSPGIGYPSGTGKNPNYAFPTDPDYTKPTWGSTPIEPFGNQTTFTPDTKFITHLYTGSEQTARVLYYNSTMHEIRHAWMPNPLTPNIWNVETVVTGVTAGWVSAAYYQDKNTLGICWYDLSGKNLT